MLIEIGVVDGHHTLDLHGLDFLAFYDFTLRYNASGHIVERIKSLILDAHSENQGVVGYDRLIVQYDVLV